MRVYMSVDMEGCTGIVTREEVEPGAAHYARGRRLMTGDVNAAIEGAVAGGATEILVNDAHWNMDNLTVEEIHPSARLIRGGHKPLGMMEGVQKGLDAVFFIGYHARAGQSGVLSHTMLGRDVYRISLNGEEASEARLNAATAGIFDIPVVLVCGDSLLCEEVDGFLRQAVKVATKRSLGRFNAECLPAEESWRLIREGAREALEKAGSAQPYRLGPSYRIEVEFTGTTMADVAAFIPGVVRTDPRTVVYETEDYLSLVRLLRAWMLLARTVRDKVY